MRIFKRISCIALFLALIVGISALLNYLLVPYQYGRVKVNHIENVAADDLILGTSHGASALDPAVMASVTGRTTYNAAMGGEYLSDSYYMLKDAVEAGRKPGRVIYELDPTYFSINTDINENRAYLLSVMKPSRAKLSYYFDVLFKEDFRFSAFLWSYYLDNISRISETTAIKSSDDYKNYGVEAFAQDTQHMREDGFVVIHDDVAFDGSGLKTHTASEVIKDDSRDTFTAFASYCRENGIELIVVTSPVPASTYAASPEYFAMMGTEIAALCEACGIAYYDFNNELGAPLDLSDASYSDADGHMVRRAAEAFSKAFADMIG